jgi:hypothetical protein
MRSDSDLRAVVNTITASRQRTMSCLTELRHPADPSHTRAKP